MKQIFNEEELVGKTIKRVSFDNNQNVALLVFEDDSFVFIENNNGYVGCFCVSDNVLDLDKTRANIGILFDLDFVSRSEYNEMYRLFQEEDAIKNQEKIEKAKEDLVKSEIAALKRLKAKYPDL